MHPLKAAAHALHAEAAKLHHTIDAIDLATAEKDSVWGILTGMLPDIFEAVQGLVAATMAYLSTR